MLQGLVYCTGCVGAWCILSRVYIFFLLGDRKRSVEGRGAGREGEHGEERQSCNASSSSRKIVPSIKPTVGIQLQLQLALSLKCEATPSLLQQPSASRVAEACVRYHCQSLARPLASVG